MGDVSKFSVIFPSDHLPQLNRSTPYLQQQPFFAFSSICSKELPSIRFNFLIFLPSFCHVPPLTRDGSWGSLTPHDQGGVQQMTTIFRPEINHNFKTVTLEKR